MWLVLIALKGWMTPVSQHHDLETDGAAAFAVAVPTPASPVPSAQYFVGRVPTTTHNTSRPHGEILYFVGSTWCADTQMDTSNSTTTVARVLSSGAVPIYLERDALRTDCTPRATYWIQIDSSKVSVHMTMIPRTALELTPECTDCTLRTARHHRR